jgi:signal transduction histidine kinase
VRLPETLRDSLRVRLLAGTLVWIVVALVAAGWGLGSLFRDHVAAQFHAELKTHLDQLAASLVLNAGGDPALSRPLSDPRLTKPYSGLYWQIDRIAATPAAAAASGLLRSRSLWDGRIEVPRDALADGEIHTHRVPGPRGSTLRAVERMVLPEGQPGRPLRLVVAADERWMIEPVERFDGVLWLSLAILGAGLLIAALVQIAVGLAPLGRMRRELAAVRSGSARRLAGPFPLEVKPLAEELNAVLARNAEIVERARTRAGNLAHALKTPLSVLVNAATESQDAREKELARLVIDQVEAAKKQVDYHLARARASALRVPGVRTPVAAVAEGVARLMRSVHAERALEIVVEPMAHACIFRGEEQDLQEMLGNLLDNACKWAKQRVTLSASAAGDRLAIVVDDDGPGLAAEQRHRVLRRGARADEQAPGYGLGLAIVDDLARLYGGHIALAESPRGGLRVTLRLPAAAPHPAAP